MWWKKSELFLAGHRIDVSNAVFNARAAAGDVIVADRRRKCDCCRSGVVGLAWRLRPDYCWSRASSAKHGGILAGKIRRARAYARRRHRRLSVPPHARVTGGSGRLAPSPADRRRSLLKRGAAAVAVSTVRGAFGAAASHITSRPPPPVRRRRIFFFAGDGGRPQTRIIIIIIIVIIVVVVVVVIIILSSAAVIDAIVILFAGARVS